MAEKRGVVDEGGSVDGGGEGSVICCGVDGGGVVNGGAVDGDVVNGGGVHGGVVDGGGVGGGVVDGRGDNGKRVDGAVVRFDNDVRWRPMVRALQPEWAER